MPACVTNQRASVGIVGVHVHHKHHLSIQADLKRAHEPVNHDLSLDRILSSVHLQDCRGRGPPNS